MRTELVVIGWHADPGFLNHRADDGRSSNPTGREGRSVGSVRRDMRASESLMAVNPAVQRGRARLGSGARLEQSQDVPGQGRNVTAGPDGNVGLDGIVGDDGRNVVAIQGQGRPTSLSAPDLDLQTRGVQMAFHENEVTVEKEGSEQIVGIGVEVALEVERNQSFANDRGRAGSGHAVTMGVLSWRVEFVSVAGVFDRADSHALLAQAGDEVDDEGRLAVVLTAYDVDWLHDVFNGVGWRFSWARGRLRSR